MEKVSKMENPRMKLVEVDGILCEEAFVPVIGPNLKAIRNFQVRKDDIFVCTYPKCGTTWIQYIVWGIINKGAKPPNINEMMFNNRFPFLEVTGTKIAEDMKSPRPLKSHLPYERVPQSPNAKYICVIRNPFDCCISYYHFIMNTDPDVPRDVTLDEFFEYFLEGNVLFGDYFDHVLSWYRHRNDDNVLFLSYEDMAKDHRGTVLDVAKFMGDAYYQELCEDEELLKKIQYHSSFSFMKSLSEMRVPKDHHVLHNVDYSERGFFNDDEKFQTVIFFRKGLVGDFKETLNDDQMKRMRRVMQDKFKDTDILDYWKDLFVKDGQKE